MIRILYIVSTLRRVGPTNQLYNIIKYLPRDKFTPIVLTLSPEGKDSRKNDFQAAGAKLCSLDLARAGGYIFGAKAVKKHVKAIRPHVVHTHGLRPDTLSNNSLNNSCRVSTIRNVPAKDYKMLYGNIIGCILTRYHVRRIVSEPYAVACSHSVSRAFKAAYGRSLLTIENGVDTECFKLHDPEERASLRHKLNISNKKTVFITVGSLISRKDMKTVVWAFIESGVAANSLLLVAGDGDEEEQLKEIARGSKSVLFLGQVSNIRDYLGVSDYFISASLSEGLPNTVLEAMSCGVVPILSDIRPHQEIAQKIGGNMIRLFPARDADQLIEILYDSIECDFKGASIELRRRTEETYSAEDMSKGYQELYSQLVVGEI